MLSDLIPQSLMAGALLEKSHNGRLGNSVSRYRRPNGSAFYVKVGDGDAAIDLEAENARLEWLHGKLRVPDVLFHRAQDGRTILILSEVQGTPSHLVEKRSKTVELLAEGLRHIHALPLHECPFQNVLSGELAEAERRIRAQKLRLSGFLESTSGRTPEEVLSELHATSGMLRDFAFTHGDYCMPNVILLDDDIAGFIDWGIAGVADIHRDFMAVEESITMNLGPSWVSEFYKAYGSKPDRERIRFYTLLDAFFGNYEP